MDIIKGEINKINIEDKKILFLGCGAVSKCCLTYLDKYFIFDYTKVIIVDKSPKEKDFPTVQHYLEQNATFIVKEINKKNVSQQLSSEIECKHEKLVIFPLIG